MDSIHFNLKMKADVKRESKVEQNLVIAFNLILCYCGYHIRSILEHDPAWEETFRLKDTAILSRIVKKNCYLGTLNHHLALATLVVRLNLCTYRQFTQQIVKDYIKELTTL